MEDRGSAAPRRRTGGWRFLSMDASSRDARISNVFSKNHSSFTERQLRRFGDWISEAVSVDSDLENAVSTCFLEHMRQVKINRVLAPYLSPVAKVKSHA